MKNLGKSIALIMAALFMLPSISYADFNLDWSKPYFPLQVRARGVGLKPSAETGRFTSNAVAAQDYGGQIVHISDAVSAELDFGYYFNKYVSVEVGLTRTMDHDFTLNGSSIGDYSLGEVDFIVASAMLQVHFFHDSAISPYIGVGGATMETTKEEPAANITSLEVSSEGGGAAELGFDVNLNKQWSINLAGRQVYFDNEVKYVRTSNEYKADNETNPIMVYLGVGYRF